MKANLLFQALKKSLRKPTYKALEESIGLTQSTMINWRKSDSKVTPKQVANLVKKAIRISEKNARNFSIKPIVEYFPIIATDSKQGAKWEIINTEKERCKKLRDLLKESHGIYIFYNSQCSAIYVGKAKRTSLWDEMNNAFNRERDPQEVWQVDHPSTGSTFKPAYEQCRKIVKRKVPLHEIAHYFSTYRIEKDLIDNAEALLIRAFANDLTNLLMENIQIE